MLPWCCPWWSPVSARSAGEWALAHRRWPGAAAGSQSPRCNAKGGARCTTRELRRVTDGATPSSCAGAACASSGPSCARASSTSCSFRRGARGRRRPRVVRLAIPSPWRQRDADGDVFGSGAPARRWRGVRGGFREPHRLVTRRTADGLELVVPRALLAPGAFPLHRPAGLDAAGAVREPAQPGRTHGRSTTRPTGGGVTSTGSTASFFSDDRARARDPREVAPAVPPGRSPGRQGTRP